MNFANETKFRQHVVAAIRKGGGFAQQIESPTLRGIPDVFFKNRDHVPGWLELKVLRPRDRNKVSISGAQWIWMSNAAKVGVNVHIFCWHQTKRCLGVLRPAYSLKLEESRDFGFYLTHYFYEKEFDRWITSL